MSAEQIKKALLKYADKEKAAFLPKFFKAGKGEYAEGDKFMGVTVPAQREVAKKFKETSLAELGKLIKSPIHEHRLTALLILTYKYPKAPAPEKEKIINLYLKNTKHVNNWDLVDLSAPKLLGEYLSGRPREILYKLSKSRNLWEKRIAMLSTYTFIKNRDFTDALKISKILLNDDHDLIHKAVGWMLREIGKLDQKTEEVFLKKYYKSMPRTMLRYAIERFSEKKRRLYMG